MKRTALIVLIALLCILTLFHRPILRQIALYPALHSQLEPSDLIVVISGGLPDVHYGVDLYKEGYGKKLLFVGHFPVELVVLSEEPFQVVERSWDEVAAHLAIASGVPEEALLFTDAFTNSTYERVESFLNVAIEHEVSSLIVVAGRLHTRRIAFSAKQILGDRQIKVLTAPTAQAYYHPAYRFDFDGWWKDDNQARTVLGEYMKLFVYWVRYGLF